MWKVQTVNGQVKTARNISMDRFDITANFDIQVKTDVGGNWTILTTTFVQDSPFSVQLAHRLSINREQND